MARGLNRVYLIGTLTTHPEMRYTPGGMAVLELTLAGSERVGDESGVREIPWYHRVKLLGRQAETWGDRLEAGQPLFVEGRLSYRAWEADGGRRSIVEILADFLDPLVDGGLETESDARGQTRLKNALNQAMLMGNLTRDVELRYTPQGTPVARMGLAVNERPRGRDREGAERTHFLEVQAWRGLAERAAELRKGEPILVIGRLVNDSWTSSTGERRYALRVEAVRLERLTRGSGGAGGPRPQRAQTGGMDIEDGLEEFPPEEDLPF
ncbi:MAG: single-stranded DNA-binding protein [Thermaceae bacterium]